MKLFAIAAGQEFLPALARGALARLGAGERLAAATILLPTRRAARALQAAFLREVEAPALLLPRMRALAGLSVEDADELALPELLRLPPAVDPLRRQAVLAGFAMRWPRAHGGPRTAEHAWALGAELGKLLDEIALEEAEPLPEDPALLGHLWLERLDALAPDALADHWKITTLFLRGAVEAWQDWLSEQGLLDIGVRRVLALRAQREAWEREPPEHAVIAAGIGLGGTIPAAADLLRIIATRLPEGAVVLPGEDEATARLGEDALDEAPTHPFAGQRAMLRRMGARAGDARPWTEAAPSGRAGLLGTALLPAGALEAWQDRAPARWEAALHGVTRIEGTSSQHEAAAIALSLRGALETPGIRAALVTPDRDLARRVAAELPRHGILADDSAGQPLSDTPPGAFLRLIAHLAAGECGPVPLLSVLKHPLCAAGWERGELLAATQLMEARLLRGPAPGTGIAGIRAELAKARLRDEDAPRIASLLDALEAALGPFQALPGTVLRPPADLLAEHLAAAEALASTPALPGGIRLYAQAEGEALARHLADLAPAMAAMPPIPPEQWPTLFEAALAQGTTRAPRISRGRPDSAHPQVEILGLLEARLLGFDHVVLGALDETIWPQAADPGPWMSRPMRREFGLPSPELRIGRVSADFLLAATTSRQVVLSRASRRGGSPSVPARWLTRLDTFLAGQRRGLSVPADPCAAWGPLLDLAPNPRPCPPPAPRPPREARPHRLTLSDVAMLIADPYGFYARRILNLSALDPLEQEPGAADYGNLIHRAIHLFLAALPTPFPGEEEAARVWDIAAARALEEAALRPAVEALWRTRLARVGGFVQAMEAQRRPLIARTLSELAAKWEVRRPGGSVTLEARADRIDCLADGSLRILDYKSGTVPSKEEVRAGTAPQLPLEALLAERGAFRELPAAPVSILEYWRLTGALEPGDVKPIDADVAAAIAAAEDALNRLTDGFLLGTRAFPANPHPGRRAAIDYRHLARFAEWSAGGDGE
ncbi:double-strand break repair protein AddB [Roseococcus sp. YIM B11640]|uniref:double-strand break repair protein AddB n=1 Tax=Roseococcus sp. YIM B11640 TaxID=3133973 RepID=UPI003C7AC039